MIRSQFFSRSQRYRCTVNDVLNQDIDHIISTQYFISFSADQLREVHSLCELMMFTDSLFYLEHDNTLTLRELSDLFEFVCTCWFKCTVCVCVLHV